MIKPRRGQKVWVDQHRADEEINDSQWYLFVPQDDLTAVELSHLLMSGFFTDGRDLSERIRGRHVRQHVPEDVRRHFALIYYR